MTSPFRVIVTLLCLAWPVVSQAQQVVMLVRHADRDGDDDALSEQGKARAKALGRLLKTAGVALGVDRATHRTRGTALHVMSNSRPVVKVIGTGDSHVDDAFEAIRQAGEKGVVLYVGHSDTIGPLLKKLGHSPDVRIG